MYSCSTTAKVKSPSVIKFTFLAFQFFRVSPVTANPNSAVPLFVPVQTRNAVSDLTGATSEVAGHNIAVREADIEHRDMKGFTPLILAPPCLWPVAGAVKDECNRWSYIQINSDIRPLRHRRKQSGRIASCCQRRRRVCEEAFTNKRSGEPQAQSTS